MTSDRAAGERFLATGELMLIPEIAHPARGAECGGRQGAHHGPLRRRGRGAGEGSRPEVRALVAGLGRRHRHSTAKAERMFGWTPRPGRTVVVACARSSIEHGAV